MTNKLIGKAVLLGLLSAAAISVQAAQAGGNGCGWGNMLFEGKSGLGPHLLATTTNGTSGNATFGLTSGTNGCDSKTKLGYGGRSMLAMNNMLEGISEDMARGNGEALSAYATLLGFPAMIVNTLPVSRIGISMRSLPIRMSPPNRSIATPWR